MRRSHIDVARCLHADHTWSAGLRRRQRRGQRQLGRKAAALSFVYHDAPIFPYLSCFEELGHAINRAIYGNASVIFRPSIPREIHVHSELAQACLASGARGGSLTPAFCRLLAVDTVDSFPRRRKFIVTPTDPKLICIGS